MRKTIAVAGALAQRPSVGGHTWVLLQYLLGFKRLGWDVLFVDRLDAGMCVDRQQLYPTGEGMIAFTTLDEALAGVESIAGNYAKHATAAHGIAEAYFDSDKVLTRLLSQLGIE